MACTSAITMPSSRTIQVGRVYEYVTRQDAEPCVVQNLCQDRSLVGWISTSAALARAIEKSKNRDLNAETYQAYFAARKVTRIASSAMRANAALLWILNGQTVSSWCLLWSRDPTP